MHLLVIESMSLKRYLRTEWNGKLAGLSRLKSGGCMEMVRDRVTRESRVDKLMR